MTNKITGQIEYLHFRIYIPVDQNTHPQSNFSFLQVYDTQLVRLGMLAEKYFPEDPNTCLIKLRQFGELLAQQMASRVGIYESPAETQFELIRRLEYQGFLPREISELFHELRQSGNTASHSLEGNHYSALSVMKIAWQVGIWFHKTFTDASFKSGPFKPPVSPDTKNQELKYELQRLSKELKEYQVTHKQVILELQDVQDEKVLWEQLASEAEEEKNVLQGRLLALQSIAESKPIYDLENFKTTAHQAASSIKLDEAETRKLIDQQLRQAGWQVDSNNLRYGKGTRPEKGKNYAIAEWPTESGPADYVLFEQRGKILMFQQRLYRQKDTAVIFN